MTKKTIAVALLLATTALAPPAQADWLEDATSTATWRATGDCPGPPAAHPDTRLGKIAAAQSYWQFITEKDGSKLKVTPDVQRIEGGGSTGTSSDDICGPTSSVFLQVTHDHQRWYVVDGDWVAGFVYLQAGAEAVNTVETGIFHVRNGLTDRIEENFTLYDVTNDVFGERGDPRDRADNFFSATDIFYLRSGLGDIYVPEPEKRQVVEAAIRSYLDGWAHHDGTDVPLAGDVHRMENVYPRGTTADEVRQQMAAPTMAVTRIVPGSLRLFVEGSNAFADYYYEESDGSKHLGTTRFRVIDGVITEIETVCSGLGPQTRQSCGDTAQLGAAGVSARRQR